MNYPKISIVTPSFNQGRYIESAIVSVMAQDYPDYEHIVMDNCSDDETAAIVARYPHVKFISERDSGQSNALNKGFRLCNGDIIGWLNADDYYLPHAFESVAHHFLTEPRIHALYSNAIFVDVHERFIRALRTHRPVKWMSLLYCYIQSTTFFFSRKIAEEGHFLEESLHYSMDKEFFARLLFKNYRFRFANEYYAAFRWHDSQKSKPTAAVNQRNLEEGIFIINKMLHTSLKPDTAIASIYRWSIRLLAKPARRLLIWTTPRVSVPNTTHIQKDYIGSAAQQR